MLRLDEDALVCDLAETYGIFDWRALPVRTVATLSAGLRPDSRIMMKLSGTDFMLRDLLLASIFDNTALLLWAQTKDGEKGRNRPKSLLASFLNENKGNKGIKTYESGEDFEKDRQRILEKIKRSENGY